MDAETAGAHAALNGVKIAPEEAENIASALKAPLATLREAAARTPFDAEPAAFLKVLQP